MSTIIDRFIVAFGLDPKEYHRGAQSVRDDTKKTREELRTSTGEMERYGKRASSSFNDLSRQAAKLFLLFGGTAAVTGFVKGIISSDAATGRLAHNLGVATETLSAWQNAMTDVGGTAEDAAAAMQLLAGARDQLNLTLKTTGHDAELRRLGVTADDLQAGPEAVLLKIAERKGFGLEDDNVYAGLLRQLGLRESMITLLKKGRLETERTIEAQKALGVTTDEDARKAAEFDRQWNETVKKLKGLARPSIEAFAETIANLTDKVTAGTPFLQALSETIEDAGTNTENADTAMVIAVGTVGLLAGAFALAHAPIIAAGAAIATFAVNMDKSNYAMQRWGATWAALKKMLFSTTWEETKEGIKEFWEETKKQAQDVMDELQALNEHESVSDRMNRLQRKADRNRVNAQRGAQTSGTGGTSSVGGGALDPEIVKFWESKGWSKAAARGMAATAAAESGSDHRIKNPNSTAYGLYQWTVSSGRQAEFKRVMGRPLQGSSKREQLEFAYHELTKGHFKAAGDKIRGAENDVSALHYGIKLFEIPDLPGSTKGYDGDMRRGKAALRAAGSPVVVPPPTPGAASAGGTTTNSKVHIEKIIIHTPAADADKIAAELPGALQRRGLTVQANRGLA